MITQDEIRAIAKAMRIDIGDYGEHVEKIQKMIDYFSILDSASLPDSLEHGQKVGIGSLREDVHVPGDSGMPGGLKFGGGAHMRSPSLR